MDERTALFLSLVDCEPDDVRDTPADACYTAARAEIDGRIAESRKGRPSAPKGKAMSKKQNRRDCPEHGPMAAKSTKWGRLYVCERPGCTVRCWAGSTSTPADETTRKARIEAHDVFDGWWKSARVKRGKAYQKLSDYMGLPQQKTHIGMFSAEQCSSVKDFVLLQLETS